MADYDPEVEAEAEDLFKADVSETLILILEQALGLSKDFQGFVAGLMLRYGLVLYDSAELGD